MSSLSVATTRTPPASQPPSSQASPLRTQLRQPHAFAASLNTAARPPPKSAACPTHFYQLDLSTLRRNGAVFCTDKGTARSDGAESSLGSVRSSARAASEGDATPRSFSLLGPNYDAPLRKHEFAASLKTSGRAESSPAACPVHAYAGHAAPHDRMAGTFGRARTGRGLLVPLGEGAALLGPDFDVSLRRKTASCTFGAAPRPDGPLAFTRSGLAPATPAAPAAPVNAPATAPRPTSMYLRRKSENAARVAFTPPPPPPRPAKLAPVRPLESDPATRGASDAAAAPRRATPAKRPLAPALAAALPIPVACAA